jgi:hypothetical protein
MANDRPKILIILNHTVKTVIIKLINYGVRLGKNIQCNLNITRGYRISENVRSNGSLYASGGGEFENTISKFCVYHNMAPQIKYYSVLLTQRLTWRT